MSCRLCLSEDEMLLPVYDGSGVDTRGVAAAVHKFLDLQLNAHDATPCQICISCWASLDGFQKFCRRVKAKQEELQKHVTSDSKEQCMDTKAAATHKQMLEEEQTVAKTDCKPAQLVDVKLECMPEEHALLVPCTAELDECNAMTKAATFTTMEESSSAHGYAGDADNNEISCTPTSSQHASSQSNDNYDMPASVARNADAISEDHDLYYLLLDWKLAHLYRQLLDQRITFALLKLLKSKHIEKILQHIPISEQILFEHHFDKWRSRTGFTATSTDVQRNPVRDVVPHIAATNSMAIRSSNEECKYSLRKILKETMHGKMIMKYYEQNKTLHEEQRTMLINTIGRYIEASGFNLSLAESAQIEKEIVEIFPTEKLEFYTTGKRGRIYNKVANLKRCSKPLAISTQNSTLPSIDFAPESDAERMVELLRSNPNIAEHKFLEFWQRCCQYRFKQIYESNTAEEILAKWPEYKQPIGLRLIDLDFRLKYGSTITLQSIWHERLPRVEDFLKAKVVNNATAELLQNLMYYSQDARDIIILWALHHLFPPTHKSLKDPSGAKIKKRYTISDSQESFLVVCRSTHDIERKLNALKLRERHMQPCLVIVGDLTEVQQIFLHFNELRFPMRNTLDAADICFKIYFVFNLEYPEESTIFYNFMQTYFYDLPPQQRNTRISTVINELSSTH